jgi:hypothetical protein
MYTCFFADRYSTPRRNAFQLNFTNLHFYATQENASLKMHKLLDIRRKSGKLRPYISYIDSGGHTMTEHCCGIRVGQTVPDFKLETYEPTRGDFGEISLAAQMAAKKWTVLFFYPADFTFV